jgi:hypothetical protein
MKSAAGSDYFARAVGKSMRLRNYRRLEKISQVGQRPEPSAIGDPIPFARNWLISNGSAIGAGVSITFSCVFSTPLPEGKTTSELSATW